MTAVTFDRSPLEFRVVDEMWEGPLAAFCEALIQAGEQRHFHPHPFTLEEVKKRVQQKGEDLYYIAVEGQTVLGYGMLRGWDDGYAVPSLGVAIHPAVRGTGLGRAFTYFLHAAARRKGAKQVRLKVYPDNAAALNLYRKLGYLFSGQEAGQLVGYAEL